jgi:hypothetical protein
MLSTRLYDRTISGEDGWLRPPAICVWCCCDDLCTHFRLADSEEGMLKTMAQSVNDVLRRDSMRYRLAEDEEAREERGKHSPHG